MERFSIREVIEQAVRTERMGYNFYIRMAERFEKDAKLRDLFETLAKKELIHEERFKELYEITGDEKPEGWDDVSEYMRAFAESEFFLGSEKALVRMEGIKDALDAVNFAIAFEKETLVYFLGMKKAVKESEVVDEIINEEQSHIMWLNRFKQRFLK